jgi:tetratricopeptide (TPR) repeat protein
MLLSSRMEVSRQLRSPLGPALLLVGSVLFFGGQGGFGSLPWIGGAAIVVAAVLAVLYGLPRGALTLAPLAGLAVWCAVSVAWSIEPDRSWAYANLAVVYLAFALVGLYAGGRAEGLAAGLAALLGAVCVWSLAGKVVPWLYEDYGRIARLRGPVGYWNALALLGDVAIPLGLWLALRRRVPGTLLVYGWLVAIALSFSRGGALVAVLVVIAWIALSRLWVEATATLVAAGLPAAGVIAIAFALSGVTSDGQSHATRVRDGVWFGLALVAGAAAAAGLARLRRPEPTPALRRAALVLAGVAAVAVLALGAVHARSLWDSFTSPVATELSNSKGRFVQVGSNHRWVWWKEAWRGFRAHPLGGTGAGSFALTNLRYRTTSLDTATEPHDLPVQFLSETGVVGAALFLAAGLTLVVVGRRRTPAELALWLALPAYLVHGLLDIDWDFAAATAPVLLVAGALAARPPYEQREPSAALARALAAGGLALAVLVSLFSVWLGDRWAGQADEALSNPERALVLAKRARSVDPLAVGPLFDQALAEQALGHDGRAHGLLLKATQVQPENPETWYTLGAFELELGCARHALTRFERFYELNSQDAGGLLLKGRALALVNSGTPVC